jgi:hypothetical protein
MSCKACGEIFGAAALARAFHVAAMGEDVAADEMLYCLECADELFRGRIAISHPSRASRAIGDDMSPSQENAIRRMEGD